MFPQITVSHSMYMQHVIEPEGLPSKFPPLSVSLSAEAAENGNRNESPVGYSSPSPASGKKHLVFLFLCSDTHTRTHTHSLHSPSRESWPVSVNSQGGYQPLFPFFVGLQATLMDDSFTTHTGSLEHTYASAYIYTQAGFCLFSLSAPRRVPRFPLRPQCVRNSL